MIPSDTPWSGLEVGKIDTRRVDAHGKWDLFWAVMPRADAALVLQLSALPSPLPDLPKLQNLDVSFQTLPGGPILFVRLRDSSQLGLFETLCRDVVAAAGEATTEAEALDRVIGRTFRWHRLLRGGGLNVLSPEEQKGLIGELRVLSWLMEGLGAKAAVASWTGPSGAPKDFELPGDCIEVKARRTAAQPHVKISNEFQLADVADHRLWLAVIAVDRVQPPLGQSLSGLVDDLSARILASNPGALMDWELHLADAGYDPSHSYDQWRWVSSDPQYHRVVDGFPRIASPVPQGVSSVSYSLALSAIAPFAVTSGAVGNCTFSVAENG